MVLPTLMLGKMASVFPSCQFGKLRFRWWINNIKHSFCSLENTSPPVVLTTGMQNSLREVFDSRKTNRLSTTEESSKHINVLELKAVYFDLISLCTSLKDTHL